MLVCACVLACCAFAGQSHRVHLSSEAIRESSALTSLAELLVTSSDPAVAYQIAGVRNLAVRRPTVQQSSFHQRSPLSALVGQVKTPSEKGSVLVLENPKYLRPKVVESVASAAGLGLRGQPVGGAPLRGPPLRGPPLRGPPQGKAAQPLRGPPLRGQPAKKGPPLRGAPPGKKQDYGKRGGKKVDGGYGDEYMGGAVDYEDEPEGQSDREWDSKRKAKKKKKYGKDENDDDDWDEPDVGFRRPKRRQAFDDVPKEVLIEDSITVGDLADQLKIGTGQVIKALMGMGILASQAMSIDSKKAEEVCKLFGATVLRDESGPSVEATALGTVYEEDSEDDLEGRPPVVTIMGHVDHGKTSLLDALRRATETANRNVTDGEAGGITQHIGAYKVPRPDGQGSVTFIDTPGHAAFNEMRSRGANITDMVVLAVAADDGIMPQTVQSIKAARAADVPIVVAMTKSDKPQADPENVRMQLLREEVVLEKFGGDVLSAEVSAKTGAGLDDLFEQIGMQAELMDLKSNPKRMVQGAVLEARQQRGSGAIADVLVQRGTMKLGDIVVAGANWGRVRALYNEHGDSLEFAGPSDAVELIGLDGVPDAGDAVSGVADEAGARELAGIRQRMKQQQKAAKEFTIRSQNEFAIFSEGTDLPLKVLDFVVKSDVQGSAEAVASALEELGDKDDKLQVKVRVIRATAGEVTQEDLSLCEVSRAQIISFNKAVPAAMTAAAADMSISINEFKIIYDAVDDVNTQIAALLRPPPSKQLGNICGKLDVKQIFKVAAMGKVAGCGVLEGFIRVGNNIRILRGNLITYEGKLKTLRSFKSEVDQVEEGNDCGMSFDDYQGMEIGDRVEAYMTPDQANEPDDDE